MSIEKTCLMCGKKFNVIPARDITAKYCSRICSDKSHIKENNCICKFCGKEFYLSPYRIKRVSEKFGNYCSRECKDKNFGSKFTGEQNHQYGLKGKLNATFLDKDLIRKNHNLKETLVYKPEHPYCSKSGRVLIHKLIVEENYKLFDIKYFEEINGIIVLKKKYRVHHKDNNHSNNNIENLQIVTISEHSKIHAKDKLILRNKLGQIIGVVKKGELLESPEVDNQQLNLNSNIFESSTTNTQILTNNVEDGNSDTSALPTYNSGDDIV